MICACYDTVLGIFQYFLHVYVNVLVFMLSVRNN